MLKFILYFEFVANAFPPVNLGFKRCSHISKPLHHMYPWKYWRTKPSSSASRLKSSLETTRDTEILWGSEWNESSELSLQIHCLSQPLIMKILELLDTKSRIRASAVSKEWQGVIAQSWNSIELSLRTELQFSGFEEWLDSIAVSNSDAMRIFELEVLYG